MSSDNLIYDIRTSDNAFKTLVDITGVPYSIWADYFLRSSDYENDDELVLDVIETHGDFNTTFKDWSFVYFHITTSANNCEAIKKYGVMDLKRSYMCQESELRIFLDNHKIEVDLDAHILHYKETTHDISYNECPADEDSDLYYRWCVGRKFYYDFTTCGFLSVWEHIPYAGFVHRRPEILWDIDNLLDTDLAHEWELSYTPHQVIIQTCGKNIIVDGEPNLNDRERSLTFLIKAYTTAFGKPSEEEILLKNHIQVFPKDIIEIKPFLLWNTN